MRLFRGAPWYSSGAPIPPSPNYYPGTLWDIDDTEVEINTLLAGYEAGLGTGSKITPPTLPQGPLAPGNAGSPAAFEALSGLAQQDITLTSDLAGTVDVWGTDLRINLNGFGADFIVLGKFGVGVPRRVQILGPGWLGQIAVVHSGFGPMQDLHVDGVVMGPDFASVPTDGPVVQYGGDGVERAGVVNCTLRGSSLASAQVNCIIGNGSDIAFVNCNAGAGLNSIGFDDDWGARFGSGTTRVWIVDSMIRSRVKPPVRTGGPEPGVDYRVLWSTPAARVTDRITTFIDLYNGNMPAAISAGGVTNRHHIELFTRWVAAEQGGPAAQLWGPSTVAGHFDYMWITGGVDVRATGAGVYSAAIFANREALAVPPELWALDALSGLGAPNTFTYADPIDPLVPAWPTVSSTAHGGFVVGSDPYL
jgi:hypothetical protein